MKKILYGIVCLIIFNYVNVFASGSVTVSTNNITLEKGESTTFTVNAENVAGVIDIISNDGNVVTLDKGKVFLDTIDSSENRSAITVTVTAVDAGSTTIDVLLTDVATFDSEELTGTKTIAVVVNGNQATPPPVDEPNNEEPNNEQPNNEQPNNEQPSSGEPNNEQPNTEEPNNFGQTEEPQNVEPNNEVPGGNQIVKDVPKTDFNIKNIVLITSGLIMIVGIGIIIYALKKDKVQ